LQEFFNALVKAALANRFAPADKQNSPAETLRYLRQNLDLAGAKDYFTGSLK